jgi:molybdopterin adenylyltransferase
MAAVQTLMTKTTTDFKLIQSHTMSSLHDPVKIGIVSISDRASTGVYEDKGLPALQAWLTQALKNPLQFEARLIPDEKERISATLVELVDAGCSLVLTTGGTGPAIRDVTPEATLAIADKEMPGFGEQMRQISLKFVPTAILSRQVAVIRGQSLIINLPGQPKSIAETLEGLKDSQGQSVVHGIFAAVPYCIDLIGGPYLETNDEVCKAFRPKTAIRPPKT